MMARPSAVMPSSLRDDGGRARVIAGDHDRANAGAPGARDGVLRLRARRIDHADQAGEHQALFDALVRIGARAPRARPASQPAGGDAKRAQRFAGQRFVGLQNLLATRGGERPPVLADDFERASRQQHVGRPLGEHDAGVFLRRVAMDRAHQLALGRKRDLADARQPLVEVGGAEAALAGRDDQRALGGIALHGPPAVALLHGGVVRAIRHRERALDFEPERTLDRSAAVARGPVPSGA